MYTVRDFGDMIADSVRMRTYVEALRRTVKPGDVVVDIGAGTGIFSLYACRFGARKVYAIEPNAAASDVARQAVRDNGYADRVEVIVKLSTEIAPPELADVIVADVRGVIPTFGRGLATMMDARTRWLRPGGTLIPLRDRLRVAVVESDALYDPLVAPWDDLNDGFDLSAARRATLEARYNDRRAPIQSEQLLSDSAVWATIEYGSLTSPDLAGAASVRALRRGTGHGLVLWFEGHLTEHDRYDTAPGRATIYSHSFLPWREPVALEEGDPIDVHLRAHAAADDYAFSWHTTAKHKEFRQTDFFAQASPEALLLTAPGSRVSLDTRGETTLRILELLRSGSSLGDAARALKNAQPAVFSTVESALTAVRDVARKYTSRIAS